MWGWMAMVEDLRNALDMLDAAEYSFREAVAESKVNGDTAALCLLIGRLDFIFSGHPSTSAMTGKAS